MTPDAALLFAAGFGTRMRPLTDNRPKPLIKIGGETLLDHALALCAPLGLRKTAVNAHYLHEQITDHLAGRPVEVLVEMPDILETGGGLRAARPTLGKGPVFTLNTDAIWQGQNPLAQLRDAWDGRAMGALLACVHRDQTIGHSGTGDFSIAPDGRLSRGGPYVFSGAQIIDPTGIEKIEDRAFSLNLLWNKMEQEGRLFGTAYRGRWCDVGHPGGIALAEEAMAHV